jgi:hypothetical protein
MRENGEKHRGIIWVAREIVLEIWKSGSNFERQCRVAGRASPPPHQGRVPANRIYSKPGANLDVAAGPVGSDEGAAMKTLTIEIPDEILEALDRTPEEFERDLSVAAEFLKRSRQEMSPEKTAEVANLLEHYQDRLRSITAFYLGEPRDQTQARELKTNTDSASERFSPEEAESQYRKLGRWKDPEAAAGDRNESWSFWLDSGATGASWLAHRLREEKRMEALHGAASLLADLGGNSILPIYWELSRETTPDQALALLRALGWLGEKRVTPDLRIMEIESTLNDYLRHDDPDIREAAARAMRLLGSRHAVHWLTSRLRDESDADVRTTIEEELAHHQART